MMTIDQRRLRLLVGNGPDTTFHLFIGSNNRGMVFFVCEQAPLLTLKSHDLPARCPICCAQNPLNDRMGR
jgi:hypothetical protein